MESRAHALVAVVFLLLLGVAVAIVGLWMHHGEKPGVNFDVISPYSVTGLSIQAPVRFKGVRVGEVTSIGLDPANPRMIRVRIKVEKTTPITRATFAELAPQGVTGLSYLSLTDKGTNFAPLAHKPGQVAEIPMHPSFFEVLSRNGESLVNRSNELADRLNDLLNDQNRARFGQTLTHLDQATQDLVQMEDAMMPALKALPAMVAATQSTMVASHQLIRHLDTLAVQAQAPLVSATQAANSLQKLGAASEQAMNTLNYQTLPQVQQLTSSLLHSSEALSSLSQSLKQSPQSLLYGTRGPPPGPGESGFSAGGH
ncbi:MCE family protein [Acidithiobacillus sp. HP-6]|uniref:MlaD family protein n=1 Tax=unclassified Acidithiobacillus TaxID=2614800 RepID=UPI00187AF96F|nr:MULTISPECIES: MlaD family protein [unclassified Acidithiobacillus]MBE7563826.1 MCE family protein [Acidithiobacillus sp. HP-6]MBE7570429.1 MCE family protein [Acidithiobacillus sp. HP-2]